MVFTLSKVQAPLSFDDIASKRPVSGVEAIKKSMKNLTTSSGVYRMLDRDGKVLYVGKAKNLRGRVSSYTRIKGHSSRISRMINSTVTMVFLSTDTEIEALLLEQNLIKQLKPKYNVLLRDDKMFPDIMVSSSHPFPKVVKSRGKRSPDNNYFGPFASVSAVNQTLNYVQKIFKLRNCTDSIFNSRSRPCLQYQIKRCSGPCVGKISKEAYKQSINEAEFFLSGKTTEIKQSLASEMKNASDTLDFELAASLRDKIQALSHVQSNQLINPKFVVDADLIALARQGSQVCIEIFFFRSNQNWGNKAYFPGTGVGADTGEVLEAFIMQFYGSRIPPPLILVSHKVANTALIVGAMKKNHGKLVKIEIPSKGEKIKLIHYAIKNASEELTRKITSFENQTKLLFSLKEKFNLKTVPKRVEIYDNSHLSGTNAVGAMIVAGEEGFVRSQYRKFNIKDTSISPGDDVGMMYHILKRRFKRGKNLSDPNFSESLPDLIIVDGGATQLQAAIKVLKEVDIKDVSVIGVAKGRDRNLGREEFHLMNNTKIAFKRDDPVLFFIQRLRDEAHRFAIGAHRRKRSSTIEVNRLDKISGVGGYRKRSLLAHFGSAKGVSLAALEDLKKVDGISSSLAEKIFNHFRYEYR